ncbi:arginine-tRNA-protein transferase [Mycena amicta]|nr:arginine-tRNA-protein transferase [Mycena amicta]
MVVTILSPAGARHSTCGYCSSLPVGHTPPGEQSAEKTFAQKCGAEAHQMGCDAYKRMMDMNWRRSGTWLYLPNLEKSCCPLYTIRLDVLEFKLSKSKRKLLNRWNRFILGKALESKETAFSLVTAIHASESTFLQNSESAHKFEVVLEPCSYSKAKFELFCKYQEKIHHDSDNSPASFRRFLVDSPLRPHPIPYASAPPAYLPESYGSYHQLYKCDSVLVAVGVLDILPGCVSSVYFFYDPDWENHSLGKLSALREAALAAEIHQAAGAPDKPYLYMGLYVYTCPKMRYKGDYSPSYLADPETFEWFPLTTCTPLLEKYRYACFSNPQHSTNKDPKLIPAVNTQIPPELLAEVKIVAGIEGNAVTVIPVNVHPVWETENDRLAISACIAGLREELAKEIVFYVE